MKNFNSASIAEFPERGLQDSDSPGVSEATEKTESRVEQIAQDLTKKIIELRLTVPALLFLEMHKPVGSLFHTSALFAQPFISPFLGADKVRGLLEFLNEPENLNVLIRSIERQRMK